MEMKQNVLIKGTKDGLVFLLNDDCSFDEVVEELKDKLENSHQQLLNGPIMRTTVKTGHRILTDYQKELLHEVFKAKGNLYLHSIEHETELEKKVCEDHVQLIHKTIRSGQVLQYEGNILLVGDINPGGILIATGDIYILGTLRGIAHAGINGNKKAVIAASVMEPTQLRIAEIVTRPPEERAERKTFKQEVAYIHEDQIRIEYIQFFSKLRKALGA